MQTKKIFLIWVLVGQSAFATSYELDCKYNTAAGLHQGCIAPSLEIGSKQEAQVDFELTYVFNCQGHHIGLALTSDLGNQPIAFGDAIAQTANVSGYGPFKLQDLDARSTFLASLVGPCSLTFSEPKISPSRWQLGQWQDEARKKSAEIKEALDTWLLVRDYDALVNFDNRQFQHVVTGTKDTITGMLAEVDLTWEAMINPATGNFWNASTESDKIPPAWNDLLSLHAELVNLVLLYNFALNATLGRPQVHTPEEAEAAARAVESSQSVRYMIKLKNKIREGQELVDRAVKWSLALKDDLLSLQKDIANNRTAYPAELGQR